MGIVDKLMFWKKDDDLDFDKIADQEISKGDSLGTSDPTLDLDQQQKDSLGLNEKSMFEDTTPAITDPLAQPTPNLTPQQPLTSQPPAQTTMTTAAGDAEVTQHLALINSKLDTVKVILNTLDQRLANLEKSSGLEKKEKLW